MYFQKPGRKSEKTWKKFRKPGENFKKIFGHPDDEMYNQKVFDTINYDSKLSFFLWRVVRDLNKVFGFLTISVSIAGLPHTQGNAGNF